MQESGENYLETILIMQNKYVFVRAIDIANELGYTKPRISR
ncbi:MAG: metal-dependent transcriptional regulator, partial [Clostridia bacterium]|nr:metal-dependent transcriptional regulator [Clostridia bacterium]